MKRIAALLLIVLSGCNNAWEEKYHHEKQRRVEAERKREAADEFKEGEIVLVSRWDGWPKVQVQIGDRDRRHQRTIQVPEEIWDKAEVGDRIEFVKREPIIRLRKRFPVTIESKPDDCEDLPAPVKSYMVP